MKKTDNKGISFIEILIAVVIFTIAVIPIGNQLIVSMRIGQKADDQQAATDYAKSVVETMKQMELQNKYSTEDLEKLASDLQIVNQDGSAGTLTTTRQFGAIDKDGNSIDGLVNDTMTIDQMYHNIDLYNKSNTSQVALTRNYTFSGTTTVDYRTYDVEITMDSSQYAKSELNSTSSYEDPNNVNLGNLSSLDAKTTALISNVSNYDATVADAVETSIITSLENSELVDAQQLAEKLKNGTSNINNIFTGMTKKIKVTVTDSGLASTTNKYKVTCYLEYDLSVTNPVVGGKTIQLFSSSDLHKQYIAYEQEFEELPAIYLMYNQFMFHGDFGDDLIVVQNNITGDMKTVKLYVVRTNTTDEKISGITPPSGTVPSVPDDDTEENTSGTSYNRLVPAGDRDKIIGGYAYSTSFVIGSNENAILTSDQWSNAPVEIYTNILLGTEDSEGRKTLDITGSLPPVGDVTTPTKLTVNLTDPTVAVKPLYEDERYSEQGRIYDIRVKLTRLDSDGNETSDVTIIDTSKGDY